MDMLTTGNVYINIMTGVYAYEHDDMFSHIYTNINACTLMRTCLSAYIHTLRQEHAHTTYKYILRINTCMCAYLTHTKDM